MGLLILSPHLNTYLVIISYSRVNSEIFLWKQAFWPLGMAWSLHLFTASSKGLSLKKRHLGSRRFCLSALLEGSDYFVQLTKTLLLLPIRRLQKKLHFPGEFFVYKTADILAQFLVIDLQSPSYDQVHNLLELGHLILHRDHRGRFRLNRA